MTFSDSILGHQSQRGALVDDLKTNNVAHAYLLAGPRHVGKFTIAKWFATELLSSDAATDEERKKIAHAVDHLIHPDLLVIDQLWIEEMCEDFDVIAKTSNVPQQHRKKGGARTDTVGIEDIRILNERLQETGTGTYRCALIRSAERMQAEAVNALLKILEEPPQGVVFLLTTQALPSLLPTLRSRMRVLHFQCLPARELQPLLAGIEAEDAQFLLHLALGAPGIIRLLREDPDRLRSEHSLAAKALSFWQSRSLAERLNLLAPLHDRTPEAQQFLLHLALSLRMLPSPPAANAVQAFHQLLHRLETNASRQLLAQSFVLDLADMQTVQ
ncbi:hypothetical protein HY285_05805 [Candidatus Peregrinibacteria bacterium]|nr:hypothetical protein [Candidatus Peregrinibacteria bacterium]MBI3817022.1 hypothetical protein [Candidatus Peregrinibacteria bacterium]